MSKPAENGFITISIIAFAGLLILAHGNGWAEPLIVICCAFSVVLGVFLTYWTTPIADDPQPASKPAPKTVREPAFGSIQERCNKAKCPICDALHPGTKSQARQETPQNGPGQPR